MKDQSKKTLKKMKQHPGKTIRPCKGVKGLSIVANIPKCDRSKCVYPEYMHLLMGILKKFMFLWFDTSDRDEWSLMKGQDDIDKFLENIQVPDYVTRIPRPTTTFKHWKANECRSFILYFSTVIFSRVMKKEYFQHGILLVSSLYLLLQSSVPLEDIERANVMLRLFVRDFAKLYPPQHLTYNFHNLLHLPLTVVRWGPLWSNSAFPL